MVEYAVVSVVVSGVKTEVKVVGNGLSSLGEDEPTIPPTIAPVVVTIRRAAIKIFNSES